MTREQAIEIEKRKLEVLGTGSFLSTKIATANIDALIELGVLTVKVEPKNYIYIVWKKSKYSQIDIIKRVFYKEDDASKFINSFSEHEYFIQEKEIN